MDRNKVKAVFVLGILVSILVACGGEPVGNPSALPSTTSYETSFTDTPSGTLTAAKSSTPSSTQDFFSLRFNTERARQSTAVAGWTALSVYTEQARQSTAVAIATAERTLYERTRTAKETQITQFSVDCDEMNIYSTQISPDGNWVAVSCGYSHGQTMIVKSKQGATWILELPDFVLPRFVVNGAFSGYGDLFPESWSPDGKYLYFSAGIGFDGGGDQCFPEHLAFNASNGLYQLNLNNGSWVTLLPPTDSFPGYGVRFSPTGRRYAVDLNGITIADLRSGDLVQIDTSGVMDLLWSPDGLHLAYSVANCNESGWVQSAAIFVWDSSTNQTQKIFSIATEKILLYPEVWIDNSILRVSVEKPTVTHPLYEIYDVDITSGGFVLWGTATPSP